MTNKAGGLVDGARLSSPSRKLGLGGDEKEKRLSFFRGSAGVNGIRRLLPTVIFGFSSTRLTAAAKEANCFAVCTLSFCSSRQRTFFYTTSQVLRELLI